MAWLAKYQPYLLSILRIVAGLLFLEHGTAKLLHFPYLKMFDHLVPIIAAAGAIEIAGGVLVTIGLFTRLTAFLCAGEMAVGYWLIHVARGGLFPVINQGGEAILFCFVFLFLAAAGPGPLAVSRSEKV